jgi:sugar lactone lactonase YvrE
MTVISALSAHACELGESPLWHPQEQALYCVDIPGREVLRFRAGVAEPDRWPQASEPSCLALTDDGRVLVTRRDGLWVLNGERIAPPPYDASRLRFNDGKVGPDGRLWVGTISDAREPEGVLYRWTGQRFEARVGGLHVSNGLAWSPDGRRVHWSDTKAHRIYAAEFDPDTGALGEPWVFKAFEPKRAGQAYGGRPDGAAMDAEGCYWSAMFEGGCLLRLAPNGEIVQRLELPVTCPTMPTFGGPGLSTLYVTTAREKRPADELAREPLAGCVLAIPVPVPGLPTSLVRSPT